MLNKRLIGMVVVKDGWAVQSFGYNRYLPLGKPECLVENLDRWGADEIVVLCLDRSKRAAGPDLQLVEKLSGMGLGTPLIYGGGIRAVSDGVEVIRQGADRICVDALLHNNINVVKGLSNRLGGQAVIGVLPLSWKKGKIEWLDYQSKKTSALTKLELSADDNAVSEFLVVDWSNEGSFGSFDLRLIRNFPMPNIPLIAFGGVTTYEVMSEALSMPVISAIAVGNSLNYREHSIQSIKEQLTGQPLRPSNYGCK